MEELLVLKIGGIRLLLSEKYKYYMRSECLHRKHVVGLRTKFFP